MCVVIAGGGIGGLATALMLHEAGIDCEVHERSEAIRELGVGINLLSHAVQPLAELGLLDRLNAVAIRTAELRYTHRLGHQIISRRCGLDAGHPVPQLSIHRGRLLGVLHRAVIERLGPATVRTGRRLMVSLRTPTRSGGLAASPVIRLACGPARPYGWCGPSGRRGRTGPGPGHRAPRCHRH